VREGSISGRTHITAASIPLPCVFGGAVSPFNPEIDELVESARNASPELVAHLLGSDDDRAVRLGRAIQTMQRNQPTSQTTETSDRATLIDPVRHDPAW
jgi:hypothetical protein